MSKIKNKSEGIMFKRAKTPRNELELPTLHFVVMDQWVDVIGERALFAWLKMYTWCDRSEFDGENEANLWEQARIPTSFNKIIKKLKVGRSTFYEKILQPLWNVGLIDIEEYNESTNKGTKPMNVIVYSYPQNDKSLSYKPLTEVRDYNKDYHSKARMFAERKQKNAKKSDGDEVEEGDFNPRTDLVQGGIPGQDGGGYYYGTGGGTEIGHNNRIKSFNNNLNSINNNFNYSSSPDEQKGNIHNNYEEDEEKTNQLFNNVAYRVLAMFLLSKGIENRTIIKTIKECHKKEIEVFAVKDVEKQ